MIITVYSVSGTKEFQQFDTFLTDVVQNPPSQSNKIWYDFEGEPDVDDMSKLAYMFYLHPLTVEDIIKLDSNAKWEIFDNYLFIICMAKGEGEFFNEMSIILGDYFILTFHRNSLLGIDSAWSDVRQLMSDKSGTHKSFDLPRFYSKPSRKQKSTKSKTQQKKSSETNLASFFQPSHPPISQSPMRSSEAIISPHIGGPVIDEDRETRNTDVLFGIESRRRNTEHENAPTAMVKGAMGVSVMMNMGDTALPTPSFGRFAVNTEHDEGDDDDRGQPQPSETPSAGHIEPQQSPRPHTPSFYADWMQETIQSQQGREIGALLLAQQNKTRSPLNVDFVLYALLNELVMQYKKDQENLDQELEALFTLTQSLHTDSDQEDLLLRFDVDRRILGSVRHGLSPYRDLLSTLCTQSHTPFISPNTVRYLRSVFDVVVYVLEKNEHCRDALLNTHTNYLSFISVKLSRVSNKLAQISKDATVLTAVLGLLQIIGSTYGMNIWLPGGVDEGTIFPFLIIITVYIVIIIFSYILNKCLRWDKP
ncbi:putative CorA-like Mg2+ transporter protein [Blattamonas nauphoetae]|uniref:CorA-like Mg2+ transporter protein n=1 Tax=Blattamonas nauphoetae TaxID=2049346 RepID=A0ABQ9XQN3_9EUKA|nr:putative CorA-like Mg2+ transporter protein [Blattamonas nauphoetae]